MRELKFRAWDGKQIIKSDDYFENHILESNDNVLSSMFSLSDLFEYNCNDDLSQFSGLLDKNGVDIYENDIVKYVIGDSEKYRTGTIVFINGYYAIVWANSLWSGLTHILNEFNSLIEVIGNIYENPELL